jgi:hypothetical protein
VIVCGHLGYKVCADPALGAQTVHGARANIKICADPESAE